MRHLDPKETERYYSAYQRLIVLSLVFVVCLGGCFLALVLGYGGDRPARGGLIIGALFLVGFVAMKVNTTGGRLWGRRDPLIRTVFQDEWSRATRNRACRTAFALTMWAQVPLMWFMANVPPDPSDVGILGMAALTMTVGLAAFFGAYLYYGRQPTDG
jgi:hypothetical protein